MKVIIEINNFISLEMEENQDMNEQIRIWFQKDTVTETSAVVKIEELKLALRKLTAK